MRSVVPSLSTEKEAEEVSIGVIFTCSSATAVKVTQSLGPDGIYIFHPLSGKQVLNILCAELCLAPKSVFLGFCMVGAFEDFVIR